MLRVVANRWTYLIPQTISAQRTDSGLMTVLQQMSMSRVVTTPQAVIGLIAKSAHPCRWNTPRLGENANHIPERKEVGMIFRGPRKVRNGRHTRDRYARKSKKRSQTMVQTTGSRLPECHVPQSDDIIFTQTDVSWVHNPHEDALVITAKVANSLIHRLLVDSGSAVNILYWGVYQNPYDLSSLWVHRV